MLKLIQVGAAKMELCKGVIMNEEGMIILAYSLSLGHGSCKRYEAKALLFVLNWCIDNGYNNINGECDLKFAFG